MNKAQLNKDTWTWTFIYDQRSSKEDKIKFYDELDKLGVLCQFKKEHPEHFKELFHSRWGKEYLTPEAPSTEDKQRFMRNLQDMYNPKADKAEKVRLWKSMQAVPGLKEYYMLNHPKIFADLYEATLNKN